MKELRSTELARGVALGRRLLRILDVVHHVLFVIALVVGVLCCAVLLIRAHDFLSGVAAFSLLLGVLVALCIEAFLYRLATTPFRIFLSAADLYAASFRDDFDPAANKRRDDLIASIETIKNNGAPASADDAQ